MTIKKEQFLPAITTLSALFKTEGTSWQEKIKEISELGLKKAAVFPTCLKSAQRQEMYKLLENSGVEEIPFVHLRSDMSAEELGYLIKRFKAQVFNIHTESQHPLESDLSAFQHLIFIENTFPLNEEEVKRFGGVCVDFSHLGRDSIQYPDNFEHNMEIIKKNKIGCNHIAAVGKEKRLTEDGSAMSYDRHYFKDLSEFDYLKGYPKEFFSQFCAMELENSLKEQLKAIDYIYEICR